MRAAAWLIFALFVGLAAAMLFIPPPPEVVAEARRYFDDEVIARGRLYALDRRLIGWSATLVHLAFVLVFAGPWGQRIAATCRRLARGWWLPNLLLLGGFYYVVASCLNFPFDLTRFALQRDWGLSDRWLADWFAEYRLGLAVQAGIEAIVLVGLFALMRWLPRWWWLAATAGSIALAVVFAYLMPIVFSPLFNTFTPIGQTKWAAWEPSLRKLATDAGVPVQDVLVMNASAQSRHTNAYFAGFGSTRRIVLFDNLLEKNTLPEVESVLGHELGHWLHDHIVRGIALGGGAALVGFAVLALILRKARAIHGWQGPGDPASLPLLVLLLYLGSWVAMPAANAVSRHFERQADQMALELAKQPDVFISAEKKLATDNLANVTPAPWSVWLFSTHPPVVERIRMAEQWRDGRRD